MAASHPGGAWSPVWLVAWACTAAALPTSDCCYPTTLLGGCQDGTMATPCCGYGSCDPFCCKCDDGCRSPLPPATCGQLLSSRSLRCMVYNSSKVGKEPDMEFPCTALDNSSALAFAYVGPLWGIGVVYDFGKDKATVTAVQASIAGLRFSVFSSEDGAAQNWTAEPWDNYTYTTQRDLPRRLEPGRITTRFLMLLWQPVDIPIRAWLLGCAAAPDADVRPSSAISAAIVTLFRRAALVLAACGCCGCSALLAWCLRRRRRRSPRDIVEVPLLPRDISGSNVGACRR